VDFGFEVDSICWIYWIYWMGSVSAIVVAKYHCRSRILQLLGGMAHNIVHSFIF